MRQTRTALASAAVLALLGGLAACGDDSGSGDDKAAADFAKKPAADIVAAAQEDMLALDSVHLGGTITSDGQEITLDLTVSGKGDCQGTFGIDDGSAEIVAVDGKTWLKPNEAFWKSQAGASADQIIAAVGDKYVLFPAGDDNGIGDVCDLKSITEGDDTETDKTYEVKGTDEIDGKQVVQIEKTSGDNPGGVASILTGDDHWIVKLENQKGDDKGSVEFTDFNADFSPEAPADDDVVDLSTLGG